MLKKIITYKTEGLLEEFSNFAVPLMFMQQKGGNGFITSLKTPIPLIIFARCHSILSLLIKDIEPLQIDAYSTIIIPAGISVDLVGISSTCELVLLSPTEQLIKKVSRQYAILIDELNDILTKVLQLPRSNWVNEIMHRYAFELMEAKSKSSDACTFLSSEILKETFFLYKEQNIALKNKFNLDTINLDRKSPIVRKAINFIEANLFKDISMDSLAKNVYASKSTMLRAFANDIGVTPFNYTEAS